MLSKTIQSTIKARTQVTRMPWDVVAAIIDKESGGSTDAIRIEGHYAYKLSSGLVRDRLVKAGLASSKAGAIKNPKSMQGRRDMLKKIVDIAGPDIAYQCISMGLGQIMGTHYYRLGFLSPQAMYEAYLTGARAQLDMVINFITSDYKLLAAVRNKKYAAIARIYNGKNYKKNNYDTDLETLAKAYSLGGSVDVYLDKIITLGYADVQEFQSDNGLVVDGIIGPVTRRMVDDEVKAGKSAKNTKLGKTIAAGVTTVAVSGGVVADATNSVQDVLAVAEPVMNFIKEIAPVSITLAMCGAGAFAAWYAYRTYCDWRAS